MGFLDGLRNGTQSLHQLWQRRACLPIVKNDIFDINLATLVSGILT
jgi:hypothetical protein